MSGDDLDALVVGAGVSGLTTAVCLAEAGRRVRIWAAGTDDKTTSYAAGATWSPYLVESSDRVRAWSFETLQVLRELAADPDTGIVLMAGVEAAREPVEPPEWVSINYAEQARKPECRGRTRIRPRLRNEAWRDPDLGRVRLGRHDSGARRGELCAHWSDLDLDAGALILRRALYLDVHGQLKEKDIKAHHSAASRLIGHCGDFPVPHGAFS
jgi:glycine/D-amino acid oxidase-like deaminating enzyme